MYLFIYFWLCQITYGILVPQPGFKLWSPAMQVQGLNPLNPREVHMVTFDIWYCESINFYFSRLSWPFWNLALFEYTLQGPRVYRIKYRDYIQNCIESINNLRRMCVLSGSIVPNSLQPHGLQPIRLLSLNFPGKNTGVNCRFLLHEIFPAQGSNPGDGDISGVSCIGRQIL